MHGMTDFTEVFAQLKRDDAREQTTQLGGVNVRLVRVAGGGEGRWDSHAGTAETVIVWSGEFTVDYRDGSQTLTPGQCCVVPAGVEHRGTSKTGAEIVLFQQAS